MMTARTMTRGRGLSAVGLSLWGASVDVAEEGDSGGELVGVGAASRVDEGAPLEAQTKSYVSEIAWPSEETDLHATV